MNDRERREFETSMRSLLFLNTNSSDFTDIPAVAAVVAVLETETATLSALGADKVGATSGAKDATIYRGDLRDHLRDAMQYIADMWKPMAKNYENAQNKFRMPNGSDQLMVDTAGSFIIDAEPLKEAFMARGMKANFISDLTAKRDAFAEVVEDATAARLGRIGVNAAFRDPLKKCREAIDDVDPIVKMKYRDNPAKLAEWLSASRVERR